MKLFPGLFPKPLHLLLLLLLVDHSISQPSKRCLIRSQIRGINYNVNILEHLTQSLLEHSNKQIKSGNGSMTKEYTLTSLPALEHTTAHLPGLKINETFIQLYLDIQNFKVHFDWLMEACRRLGLSCNRTAEVTVRLQQLSHLSAAPLKQAATRLLDEMCHLTAQSLTSLETSEHFQVVKLLGEGSYGKVMLAVHKKRGTPMALKFFPRASTPLISFLREYHLSLSFCTHPFLTKALGIVFSTPSHYVFAQQAGLFGDLYDIIIPDVGVEEDCAQRVVSQLSGALGHLHSLGFVHRDLKPENVFLCDAACRSVKLGDFGMVRPVGSKVPGVWYSSPYCTPETQVAMETEDSWPREDGDGVEGGGGGGGGKTRVWVSVEASTDCWALGILTYAMLTGSLPWSETTSHNRSYRKYTEWFDGAKSEDDGLDVWGETESKDEDDHHEDEGERLDERPSRLVAPQFICFTQLACTLFQTLLNPRPRLRGRPEDVPAFLGGDWMREKERTRLEEERKRRQGKGGIGNAREMEGRGER